MLWLTETVDILNYSYNGSKIDGDRNYMHNNRGCFEIWLHLMVSDLNQDEFASREQWWK